MKKTTFTIIFLLILFSQILYCGISEQTEKGSIKKHITANLFKNVVLLSWDKLADMSAEDLSNINVTVDSIKELGYMVNIYEKNIGDKATGVVNDLISEKIIKTIFTQNNCLSITGLKSGKEYYINIKYLYKKTNEELLKELFTGKENECGINIKVTGKDKRDYKGDECSVKTFNVTLKELYENRDAYVGKILELEGYNKIKKEWKFDVFNAYYINQAYTSIDTFITDGKYLVNIQGGDMEYEGKWKNKNDLSVILKVAREDDNYQKIICYFYKKNGQQNNNKPGSEYRCIYITSLEKSKR